ncbi:3-deoxy-D-manno-octulosonic acid transferase [Agarivorans sp. Alg241-V36]|uniref:3-deoxy-D-manno-octulosonic acid transferase n=1 Tax=Agarivorans sp. Alg241-V36 TaxID=2305992 RepID=UPI0013D31294|nr:3-deoxy-D-manno-octulosonic acid transferase [Agarivorans sp. Alg241-V36]
MYLNQQIEKHFTLIYWSIFVSSVGLLLLYASNQILTGDQTQMLLKGYLGAYHGTWLSYGNAASVVGNVPGSLSALLVGLPLLIWDSPWSPMLLLPIIRLMSFFLFDHVIKQCFSPVVRISFAVLYLLSPWFLFDSLIYNPAYLCFFAGLHCWSAFKMRQSSSFIYGFLHVVAIGLAMQIHYSWPILAAMSAYLYYRGIIKINWWGIVAGGLAVLASLVPYLMEVFHNPAIQGQDSDRYIGWGAVNVYPVLKAALYWLRYSSFLFTNRIIVDANFLWLTDIEWLRTVVDYIWQAVLFTVGGITVICAWVVNKKAWKVIKPHWRSRQALNLTASDWLMHYAFSAFLGIIVSAMLSPIIFSYWHLIIAFAFALFPVLYYAEYWQQKRPERLAKITAIVAAYFLVVNLVASHDSNKYTYLIGYQEQVEAYLEEQGLSLKDLVEENQHN